MRRGVPRAFDHGLHRLDPRSRADECRQHDRRCQRHDRQYDEQLDQRETAAVVDAHRDPTYSVALPVATVGGHTDACMAELCHSFKTDACHHAVASVTASISAVPTVCISPAVGGAFVTTRALHTLSGGQQT